MSDDQEISKLISQSLRRNLTDAEQQKIGDNVENNEEARKYAELSKSIHESVAGYRPNEEETGQALPDDVRKRLQESVEGAIQEKLSMSQAGLIADPISTSKTRIDSDITESSISKGDLKFLGDEDDDDKKELVIRFQRLRKLATGGVGEVWVARDEKLGRNVVIKELNPVAKESASAWDRFQREAEITGLLEHPNIVPLYMYGVDRRTAEPFYAMRFVGQRNLKNAIEEHHDLVAAGQGDKLSLYRLLNIFLDVCQAIAYAHSRGVIHRDLKPENVSIDNFGQVIVLDWGLAKILEDSELSLKLNDNCNMTDSSLMLTSHGEVVGTPIYMSPEQAAGQIEQIDTRTDVYGLGSILFSILTNKAPHFGLAEETGSGFKEVIAQIAEAPAPQPSQFTDAPAELESICVRALARKRHLRFNSVTEFAEAVEKWMAGQSGKKVGYEKLQMEGRELRTDLQTRVYDLERNASFCTSLPPVQEIIKAQTEEEERVWQKRLSTILVGLMGANPGYQSIAYGRFEDDSYTELVRVEKLKSPSNAVRSIPRGRLQTLKQNSYLQQLAEKLPGETLTALVCEGSEVNSPIGVGLQAGIPVYDQESEDVFGFFIIRCDINELIDQQMSRRHSAKEIIVACDTYNVMSRKVSDQIMDESKGELVANVSPCFSPAVEFLQTHLDYFDSEASEIYGARIWFDPGKSGLMFLLKQ